MMIQNIVKTAKYMESEIHLNEDFNDGRFSVSFNNRETFHLSIAQIKQEDVGTYYCGKIYMNQLTFADGTFLILTAIEQKPVSESVQPGDSMTLSCTIHTESCPGKHSVYWFRHGSGESYPGILYTHGGRSDQCEKSPEAGSPTQSCVYNLPKRNLSLSDAGTYYCAVASCGDVLFGNGTKLNVCGNLFITYHVLNRNQDREELNYSAVSFASRGPTSRQMSVKTISDAAVYSEVRYLQQE
ncbi:uncharacterized protein [Osmerus mordax]|uniref:uncharacterized protein n=1 Tax=Osmerus mordax TaxID=8014 RepID=UPI00350FADDA